MRAEAYGNAVTRICLDYDKTITVMPNSNSSVMTTAPAPLTATEQNGCDHFESSDVCKRRSTTTALLFAAIIVGAVALVMPDYTTIFVALTLLASVVSAAAVGVVTTTLDALNDMDSAANLVWGPGLWWCLAAVLLDAVASALACWAHCIPPHGQDQDDVVVVNPHGGQGGGGLTHDSHPERDPIGLAGMATVELQSKATPEPSPLARYRDFVGLAVGVPGRAAALCAVIAWVLVIAVLLDGDWIRATTEPAATSPLGQLASVPSMRFGSFEYCLERSGRLSPRVTLEDFHACFTYSDMLTLVVTGTNSSSSSATTISVQGNMCDLLDDADFCTLKWRASLALVLGIVAAGLGSMAPELSYVQGG